MVRGWDGGKEEEKLAVVVVVVAVVMGVALYAACFRCVMI